jgi:hypothetical protein
VPTKLTDATGPHVWVAAVLAKEAFGDAVEELDALSRRLALVGITL